MRASSRSSAAASDAGESLLDGLEVAGVLLVVLAVLALAAAVALLVRHLGRSSRLRRRTKVQALRTRATRREHDISVREHEAEDAQRAAEAARAQAGRLEEAAEHLHVSAAEMRAEQVADLARAEELDPDTDTDAGTQGSGA